MKRKTIITTLSVIGIIVLSIGANYFYVEGKMTKDYTAVNATAVIVESGEITIDASPEAVKKTLSDISKWTEWNTSVSDAKIDGDFTPGRKFSWNTESGKIESQIKVVQKDTIVWAGKTSGIFAIHSWTFEDSDGKTRVTSKESWEGLTAVILQPLLRGDLDSSLDVTLSDLKTAVERQSSN
ncbi:hypothetical protein EON76_02890 [bacterium]|nr:MAG: hypothetical protein EON76_02890 [bacterium]